MSLTFQYLLVRGSNAQLEVPKNTSFRSYRHELEGWTAFIVHTQDLLDLAEMEQLAAVTSQAHDLTLGNYVETSDFGYCIGASDGRIDFRVVINPHGAEGLVQGMWALERCRTASGSTAWQLQAAQDIRTWAAGLIETPNAEAVLRILDKDWLYSEEGVRELVRLLQVPDIDWRWVP